MGHFLLMGVGGNHASIYVPPPGGGSDPSFASVKLLLGFEGSDGSTTITDESSAAHGTATVNGNAQIDTGVALIGTSSLLLDGTGDFITFPDSADWDLSDSNSDQFTVEAFVRFNVLAASTRYNLIGQGNTAGTLAWAFRVTESVNGQLSFLGSTAGASFDWTVTTASAGLSTGTRFHVAVDKDSSGKVRIYVDGVMRGSGTPSNSAIFNSSQVLTIGALSSNNPLNGWLDEVRITKGVARYASDGGFTVPTAAFPRS
jgi:hypothetical protein